MEVARLVLEYLDVLAWPAVAALVIWLLRGQVRGLVDRTKSLSWGDKTANFQEIKKDLIEAKDQISDVKVSSDESRAEIRASLAAINATLAAAAALTAREHTSTGVPREVVQRREGPPPS